MKVLRLMITHEQAGWMGRADPAWPRGRPDNVRRQEGDTGDRSPVVPRWMVTIVPTLTSQTFTPSYLQSHVMHSFRLPAIHHRLSLTLTYPIQSFHHSFMSHCSSYSSWMLLVMFKLVASFPNFTICARGFICQSSMYSFDIVVYNLFFMRKIKIVYIIYFHCYIDFFLN